VKRRLKNKIYLHDNDTHYLLQEAEISEGLNKHTKWYVDEIRKVTKKDASKPLLIEHV
jgi:hypothetical protein